MDPFDQLAHLIATANGPFGLGTPNAWHEIQAGFAALAKWKAETDARLKALENPPK